MKALRPGLGFTLVEVLIALAIFAMAVAVLGTSYVQVLNAYELAAEAGAGDADAALARRQLLGEPDVEKARQGREFDRAGGGRVRWTATIEATELPDLFAVDLEVELTGAGGDRTLRERFRVLRPTWSEPGERDRLRADVATRIREVLADGERNRR